MRFARARAVLAAVAMAAGLAAAATAPAAAQSAGIRPHFTGTNVNIILSNGDGVGAPDPSAGHPVTEEAVGRTMTFIHQTTYFGDDAGLWRINASGGFMAMNNACNGSTVKSSSTSNGTIWAMKATTNAQGTVVWWLVNRFCDQGGDNVVLSGDGVRGHQMFIGVIGSHGALQKMFIA
jgi:hypothetical protein